MNPWTTRGGTRPSVPVGTGTYFVVEPNREQLLELTRLVDSGTLRPAVDSVFPLAGAREAFDRSLAAGSAARSCSASPMTSQARKGEAFRALHAGPA